MKSHNVLEWIGCGASAIFTALQTNQIFQTISLILTCLATLVTIAYTIYKWYKNAKKDGKIDEQEIKEGIDIIKDATDKVKELSNKDKGE